MSADRFQHILKHKSKALAVFERTKASLQWVIDELGKSKNECHDNIVALVQRADEEKAAIEYVDVQINETNRTIQKLNELLS